MKFERQIREALSHAVPELYDAAYGGGFVGKNGEVQLINKPKPEDSTLRRLPDDARLLLNARLLNEPPLNVVWVENLSEYQDLLKTAVEVTVADGHDISEAVAHETDHFVAKRQAGKLFNDTEDPDVRLGVIMQRMATSREELEAGYYVEGFTPTTTGFKLSLPKIVEAATVVRPLVPSDSDKAYVQRLGYAGVEDVAERLRNFEETYMIYPSILPPRSLE